MVVRRFLVTGVLLAAMVLASNSCKDIGDEVKKSLPLLVSSLSSVNLLPSGQATLTISGGNPPYNISLNPDPNLATAQLTNTPGGTGTLVITAAANVSTPGTTSVKIKDTDSDEDIPDSPTHNEQEITIVITVSPNPISFSTQVQPIFTTSCVNAGCHPGGGAPFSLQSGVSYGNLVNVVATTGPCAGDRRVQPSSADASALVKRLNGTCGPRMPLGGSPLTSAQLLLVRDWINQGANNN